MYELFYVQSEVVCNVCAEEKSGGEIRARPVRKGNKIEMIFEENYYMNVKKHYDNHLGNFYSWVIGDFQSKSNEQLQFLKNIK